jgi:hypothetical protein
MKTEKITVLPMTKDEIENYENRNVETNPLETKNLRAVKETKYQIFNSEEEIATLKVDEENDWSLDIIYAKKNDFLEILDMVKKIVEL